jgi:hypothetical protein
LDGSRQSGNAAGVVEILFEIRMADHTGLERRGGGGVRSVK